MKRRKVLITKVCFSNICVWRHFIDYYQQFFIKFQILQYHEYVIIINYLVDNTPAASLLKLYKKRFIFAIKMYFLSIYCFLHVGKYNIILKDENITNLYDSIIYSFNRVFNKPLLTCISTGEPDEQMGDVDDADDKQKSETFGNDDEKLVFIIIINFLILTIRMAQRGD